MGNRKRGRVSRFLPISLLPEAVGDLVRLREFIQTHNPPAANRAARRLQEAIRAIPVQPLLGHLVENINDTSLRDRFISFGRGGYWIRYQITQNEILIIKIWHGREEQ